MSEPLPNVELVGRPTHWASEMELSDAQRLAVETAGKNVCVSAGAGSGKTRVLVERFLHRVKEDQISPAQILAITYTDKAANEMKSRIVERLREEKLDAARREIENAPIGTIHSFCARILWEHPLEAGIDPHFVILSSEEAEALQEKVLDQRVEALAGERESGVFGLLGTYGERSVCEGILKVYRRSRNSERPFEEILRRRTPAGRDFFEKELKRGLRKISPVKGAEGVRGALFSLLQEKEWSVETIGPLLALKKELTVRGEHKEAVRQFKETLDDFAAFLYEEVSLPEREIFIRLALEFERDYEAAKRSERSLDFDDLQICAVRLLGSDAALSRHLRKIYQEKFHEILVDEFQDTNPLQDRLLELIKREANLFLVGDFKQSIYSFRGTDVGIFLRKEKEYAQDPLCRRISLAENYRTRPRLIDFINSFFEKLWREDSLPFERLVARRLEEKEELCVERLRVEQGKEENIDAIRMREARTLARRILSLVNEEGFRYHEIACLFRAMTPSFFYEQEFRRAGIPYYVVSSRDFYAQPEVRDLVSFLSVLENPKREVPLAALLRSPFFQVSDDTLFWLARRAKREKTQTPLGEGLADFESIEELLPSEKAKLRFFKETFQRFLGEKEKLRISELIEALLRATGYDLYVLKLSQGERRFANLRKLVEIARERESKKPLPLGDFVRALQGMDSREVRESQAQVEAEAGNVVRLMSIHQAKGLEFPVVVIPDLGGKENSEGGLFSISEEEGLGLKETLTYRRNKRASERRLSEESKRKLYVAMTRAKERLILAGPGKAPDPKKPSFHEMSAWADWVEKILGEGEWALKILNEVPPESFPFEKRKALAERKSIRTRLESLSPVRLRKLPTPLVESVFENIVPPEKADFHRLDLPVSAFLVFQKDPEEYFQLYEIGAPSPFEIKNEERNGDEEETGGARPIGAAELGTRVHQILEQWVIQRLDLREIDPLVLHFTSDLGPEEREEISGMVHRFLKSGEAEEILESGQTYPELPLVLRLPHGLVQGTMDLLYQNRKKEWVILDYKTSEVGAASVSERGEAYRIQLELYALALHEILGSPPREGRIHFLKAGLTYPIPFREEDFEGLWKKFTGLQDQILRFREERLSGRVPTNISPDRSW